MTENEMRKWVLDILGVLAKGTSLTPTVIDDNVVAMVVKAVENDMLWGWVYGLIERFLVDEDAPILVSAPEVVGINPLVVIAVIKALIALWKSLRP